MKGKGEVERPRGEGLWVEVKRKVQGKREYSTKGSGKGED